MLKGTFDELPYITALYYCAARYRPLVRSPVHGQHVAALRRGAERRSRSRPVGGVGADTLVMDLQTRNYVGEFPPEDLPLDAPSYQHVGIQTFYDNTNSTDLQLTTSSGKGPS